MGVSMAHLYLPLCEWPGGQHDFREWYGPGDYVESDTCNLCGITREEASS